MITGRARTPARAGKKTRSGPSVTAQFVQKPLPDVACLYMTPLQIDVAVGNEFETQLALSNPGEKQFQTIDIALRFDPIVLEPVRLDDDPIVPLLEGESEALVYAEAGVLYYHAQLNKPVSAQAITFLTIRWKTLGISPHCEISHASWRGLRTALLTAEEKTILGGTTNEGFLGMTLQIYSPEERADGPPIGVDLYSGAKEAERGGVRLRLFANKEKIPASEDFYVGVWFENPLLVDISKVAFKIRFDPRVLEVVDDDTDNWITSGVNIFDGEYHGKFPFDIHVANTVENDVGVIHYAMACTQRRALPERGYIARIRFRPKALARTTHVAFEFGSEDDPTATQVRYMGGDVLGETDTLDDGTEDLALTIIKPEIPRVLTAEK